MEHILNHGIIFTTFLGNYVSLGASFALPAVFHTHWLEGFEADDGSTALVSSLNIGLTHCLGLFASVLTRRFGFRLTVALGCIISTIGLLITCYATSYHTLLIGYGIVTGIGWGITVTAVLTSITYYYDVKYQGILLGITTAGTGASVIVSPILIEWLAEIYGWRGAMLIQVGFNIQLFICAAFLRPNEAIRAFQKSPSGKLRVLFRNARCMTLCFQQVIYSMGLSVVFVHLAYSVQTVLNVTRDDSVKIVSVAGVATTLSRVFVGILVKLPRVNYLILYAVQCGITGLAVLAVPFASSFGSMIFVAVCIGFGYSVYGPVLAVVAGEFVGIRNITAGCACVYFFSGVGLTLGAPIAGAIFDLTQNYNHSLYFGGASMVLSMFAIIPAFFLDEMEEIALDVMEKSKLSELQIEESVDCQIEHAETPS